MKWSKPRTTGLISKMAARYGNTRKTIEKQNANRPDHRQSQEPRYVHNHDWGVPRTENPRLRPVNLSDSQQAHGKSEGQQPGKPKLPNSVVHGIFLSSSSINP